MVIICMEVTVSLRIANGISLDCYFTATPTDYTCSQYFSISNP